MTDTIFTLRLEKKFLHEDLERIRAARKGMKDETMAIIQITWESNKQDDNGSDINNSDNSGDNNDDKKKFKIINVHVNGPNLWVIGYQWEGNGYVDFTAQAGSLNYKRADTGCSLDLAVIKSYLNELENISSSDKFYEGAKDRISYLMCVFVASEMVRNEILEKLLFCKKVDAQGNRRSYTWRECKDLYKNWASVSKVLYAVESGDFYPVIYFHDMDDLFVRIRVDENLYNSVGKMYEDILKNIKGL